MKSFSFFNQKSVDLAQSLSIRPIFEAKRKRKLGEQFVYETDNDVELNVMDELRLLNNSGGDLKKRLPAQHFDF